MGKRVKAGTSKKEATALTPKQERFAQLVAGGLNQSDAYRVAYDAKRMKAEVVHVKASELAAHGKVSVRVEELRAPVIAKMRYGLEEAMKDAEEARKLGLLMGQAGAAASAATLKAKLNGLLVEERRNERRPLEDMSDEELDRLIAHSQQELARSTLQ